jgi:uncharacterized membrane protein YhiD involved in acid resistance
MSSAAAAQITFSDHRFWAGLTIDLVAIVVLAYAVYFRRHRRRDLLMAYVCFNVALFVVVTALTSVPASGNASTGLALGLGLLGALSIIRLRSEELSFAEVAYFFSALAIALANGVGLGQPAHSAVVSAVVVAVMYAMDHLEPNRKLEQMTVELDEVYSDDLSLRAELQRRIGSEVVAVSIKQIDYVRETMQLGVAYLPRAVHESGLLDNSHQAVSGNSHQAASGNSHNALSGNSTKR